MFAAEIRRKRSAHMCQVSTETEPRGVEPLLAAADRNGTAEHCPSRRARAIVMVIVMMIVMAVVLGIVTMIVTAIVTAIVVIIIVMIIVMVIAVVNADADTERADMEADDGGVCRA
jgi:fatty acid desaturase